MTNYCTCPEMTPAKEDFVGVLRCTVCNLPVDLYGEDPIPEGLPSDYHKHS